MMAANREDLNIQVLVRNRRGINGIVLLLPLTRVNAQSKDKWGEVVLLAKRSNIQALVVLDKTPNKEASLYFSDNFKSNDIDLYLLQRNSTEAIYDSQAFIRIEDKLWIIQLHDDDEWNGTLKVPSDVDQTVFFETAFLSRNGKSKTRIATEVSPPARINFSLVPAPVWNRFIEFIHEQGGHIAGSADATLNLATRLSCSKADSDDFEYIYDNRHWNGSHSSSQHLMRLAKEDGWGRLASPEIAVLNRTIDNLCVLSYFRDLLTPQEIATQKLKLLSAIRPSKKKYIFVVWRQRVLRLFSDSYKFVMQKGLKRQQADIPEKILSRLTVDLMVIKSYQVKNLDQALNLISNLPIPVALRERFIFWDKWLSRLNNHLIN